jgi:hypothetical protein
MKPLPLSFCLCLPLILGACSNAELQDRMDSRNDSYRKLQERREIRKDAREERADARWDRMMR